MGKSVKIPIGTANCGPVKSPRTHAKRTVRGEKSRGRNGVRMQYAALPYRIADGLEILLITSRETGRWVLPKGWPMKGKTAHDTAAREALEEAGVRGKIGKGAIGHYSYGKRLSDGGVLACTVEVYPLAVERQLRRWPERGQRTLGWFDPSDAANLVQEPQLSAVIEAFAEQMAGSIPSSQPIPAQITTP